MFRRSISIFIIYLVTLSTAFSQKGTLEEVLLVKADVPPVWKSCTDEDNPGECTEKEIKSYLDNYLKYPMAAHSKKIEGVVVVSAMISEEGRVGKTEIVKDIGGGCGKEAQRLVSLMPLWQPALLDGKPIGMIRNFEIPFELQEEEMVLEEPMKPLVPSRKPKGPPELLKPNGKKATSYTKGREMPFFPGCSEFNDEVEKKRNCSNQQLIDFVSENLIYPEEAKTEGIEGIVYVSFNVNREGLLGTPKIIRDIGGGCGKEALRVVSLMPDWEPGTLNGSPVEEVMTLPVRFSLSQGSGTRYGIHWGNLKNNEVTNGQIEKLLNEDIIVRNRYGDDITISILNVLYERKSKVKEENSTGKVTLAMMRMLRKAKPGGEIILNITIQEKGEMLDIQRILKVVK